MTDEELILKAATNIAQILHIPLGEIDLQQLVSLYVPLYSLCGLSGSDEETEKGNEQMRWWLNTHNKHLGFNPASRLTDHQSMDKMIAYLETLAYH
jgi:hypothetical protein